MLAQGNRTSIQTGIYELTITDLILIDHRYIKDCIEIFTNFNADKRKKLSLANSFLERTEVHLKAKNVAVYNCLDKNTIFNFNRLESNIEYEIIVQKLKKMKPRIAKAKSLKDEVEAELKVFSELLKSHITKEEKEILPKMNALIDDGTLRLMGLEFMKIRKFSAEDLKDYPELQDELVQWKDTIQKVSSEFLSRTDKFVENLQH